MLLFLLAATVLIANSGADLTVSSYFYQSGGWPVGERFPWKLLYRMNRYPALAVATFGLCAACYGSFKPQWRPWRRQGIFLVLFAGFGAWIAGKRRLQGSLGPSTSPRCTTIWRKQNVSPTLAGGLGFGLFMSYARIAQGGHFLSDVLWAWGVVHLTALLLTALLLSHKGNVIYSSDNGELQEA